MRIADCGLRIAKLPKELETRPRSRAVATGERREEMRIADCGLRPKELETRPRSRAVTTGERREEMRIAELHIAKRA
jgi:hypothetical protein